MTTDESKALKPGQRVIFTDMDYDIHATVLDVEDHCVYLGYHGNTVVMHRHDDMKTARLVSP